MSWLPTNDGFWLLFNRDERRTRAAGQSPVLQVDRGVRLVAPIDGDFGGTWIGVNEYGMAAAILNRSEETPVDSGAGSVSRGILLRSLLTAPQAAWVIRALRARGLTEFRPFTIVAIDREGLALITDWNGREIEVSVTQSPGMVRTSSGADQLAAERARSAALAALSQRGVLSIGTLRKFHRSHLPRRGPLSVCLHRPEAATQSLTEIRVAGRTCSIGYWAGSPCRSPAPLRRRIPASSL